MTLQFASSKLVLIPAYGRRYKDIEAMNADWKAGKDFRAYGQGFYCSIRDTEQLKKEYNIIVFAQP